MVTQLIKYAINTGAIALYVRQLEHQSYLSLICMAVFFPPNSLTTTGILIAVRDWHKIPIHAGFLCSNTLVQRYTGQYHLPRFLRSHR